MSREADEVLDPFATEVEEKGTVLAPRLSTLSGASVALFSNTKKNADRFLEGTGSRLAAECDLEVADVVYKDVPTSSASEDVYETLAAADAVLIAYGDCRSCSS